MALFKSIIYHLKTRHNFINITVLFLFLLPIGLSSQFSNTLTQYTKQEPVQLGIAPLNDFKYQLRVFQQNTGIVKGRIIDSKTNLPVCYAEISTSDNTIFTQTNSKGEFMLSLTKLPSTIKILKFGYKRETISVNSSEFSMLISLIPLEIHKRYLGKKMGLEDASTLLKKAVEKLQGNAASANSDLTQRELVYCRITSSVDSTMNSLFESFSQMNVNQYYINGYQGEIARFGSTNNPIPGISGNMLGFKIDPFIRLPFIVERYISSKGSFEQDKNLIALVQVGLGETEISYFINVADTSVVYIKKHFESRIRNRLQISQKTWQDDRKVSTEISFSPQVENRSNYQIDCIIENEAFRMIRKKQSDQVISKSTLFTVIPDSSLINKAVKDYVLNETLTEAKHQINFYSKFSLSGKTSFFDSEKHKLLLKHYNPDFWSQNALIKPNLIEHKQIQNWENDNRFYSENRLAPEIELNGVDSIVKIINNNKVAIENVYLELDRNDYLSGDTIWFSAFVLDDLHIDTASMSKILYVDLINAENKLEQHLKLIIRNGRANGDFILNNDLKNGIFRIRAYTQWMRNFQDEYLFEKAIPVYKSNINNLIVVNPVINKSNEGDSVSLYLHALLSSRYKPFEKHLDLFVRLNDSMSIRKSFSFKGDFNGSMGFFVPASLSCYFADLKITLSDTSIISEQRLSVPLNSGINIQFFPESGKMVAGIKTVIAYKAVDAKGNPVEFDADIVDQFKKTVIHISADKTGVGKFDFTPQFGRTYKAIVPLYGNRYVFNLPITEPMGYVLTFNSDSSLIYIKNNLTFNKGKYYILISVKGTVYTSVEATLKTPTIKLHLPFETYPKGIIQITLFDSLFRPLAERLVFNNHADQKMLIHVETDKKGYKQREKVNLTVKVTDAQGNPVESTLSMSVIDDSKTDSLLYSSDIESYFYLASELKGEIDYTLFNLADTTPSGNRNIDLVMMTQGWRNYLWNSIRYNYSLGDICPLEKGFYIDGTILNYNYRRQSSDYKLIFFDNKTGFHNIINVEERGKFKIDIPFFYGIHSLIIQNRNKKDIVEDLRFTLDTLPVPEISYRNNELPYILYKPGYLKAINEKFAEKDSANQSNIKYIMIPEVIIKARSRPWYSKPDIAINLEKIDPTGKKYSSLFQMISGEFGEKAFTDPSGRRPSSPIFVRNDMPYIPGDLNYSWVLRSSPVNEISNVKFYEAGSKLSQFYGPTYAPDGSMIWHPVVSFTTYSNSYRGNPKGAIVLQFQGIYRAREFYKPNYENNKNNKVDNRTTIYWNPEVKTDSTGKAHVAFYNSDLIGKALIRISGVSFKLKDAATEVSHYTSH